VLEKRNVDVSIVISILEFSKSVIVRRPFNPRVEDLEGVS